jgi:inhibitor of cysteine peptidase
MTFNGTLVDTRMRGDYVYAVVNELATTPTSNATSLSVVMPQIKVNNVSKTIQPTEVQYISFPDIYYSFTTVVAVNVINDTQEPTYETVLTGATASIYVSQGSTYLTFPNTEVWVTSMGANIKREETIICRAELDNEKVVFEAQGSVPGYVLNQFSMDEYNGFFRIATTRGWGSDAVNYLTVLDMNLNIVGSISNIAPGERIYSARFMEDRCYLVTFRQIDPFYVIDLSKPSDPKILGYLEIPGFSGYLHPYDENHVIGVGKNGSNVKLSLFNVTDVNAPTEAVSSYVVQASWSDSAVLSDHKAFLFDKEKELLVLPISMTWFNASSGYSQNWQGVYVFNLSLTGGFVLRGNVTHVENSTDSYNSNYYVTRTLYIDNTLYTVSNKKVKMSSLDDLQLIKEIELD